MYKFQKRKTNERFSRATELAGQVNNLKNNDALKKIFCRLWDKLLCGGEQILTLMRQFIIHYVEAVFVRCSRLLEESSIASMKEVFD